MARIGNSETASNKGGWSIVRVCTAMLFLYLFMFSIVIFYSIRFAADTCPRVCQRSPGEHSLLN